MHYKKYFQIEFVTFSLKKAAFPSLSKIVRVQWKVPRYIRSSSGTPDCIISRRRTVSIGYAIKPAMVSAVNPKTRAAYHGA